MPIFGMIKAPKLYEDVCSMLSNAPTDQWSPYCKPLDQCNSGPGSEYLPRVKMTISWTDDTKAPIDGACRLKYGSANPYYFYNGQTIIMCPSIYHKTTTTSTYTNTYTTRYTYEVAEWWDGGALNMNRWAQARHSANYNPVFQNNYTYTYKQHRNRLGLRKQGYTETGTRGSDKKTWNYTRSVLFGSTSTYYSTTSSNKMGVMTEPKPTLNAYNLGGTMFTSWTDPVTTVTYTWEKERNWECIEADFRWSGGSVKEGDFDNCEAMYGTTTA